MEEEEEAEETTEVGLYRLKNPLYPQLGRTSLLQPLETEMWHRYTEEEIRAMSAGALKRLLDRLNISYVGCVEKRELVDLALQG